MKRIRATNMTQVRVNIPEGFCELTLIEEKGQPCEVRLPIRALLQAAAGATRGKISHESRQAAGPLEARGGLQEFPILNPRSLDVGTEPMQDPPAVLLIIDYKTETQLVYRIHPDAARELARRIFKACDSPPQQGGPAKH